MPRRSVHPDAAFADAKNNAVIAEDSDAGAIDPQTRRRAFARARMSKEEMSATAFVGDPDGMNLHAFAARKAVNHEQFVEGIFERINRTFRIKVAARQHHAPGTKFGIKPGFLVRSHPQER